MKTGLFFAAATSLLPGFFLLQASGGASVVVVDFERAVSDAPGAKDAIKKITALRDEKVAALNAKQKEATDLENRLRVQNNTLTETARTQLTRNLETTRDAIQTMGEEGEKQIADLRQQLLGPIEQKTAMAVSAYAQEHSVKIVLDASALQGDLLYVHDTADITTEIIRRIASDIQHPVQQDASWRSQRLLNRKWMDFSLGN
jgi:Skp family chaperone for outer membrane proteins